MGKVEVKQTPRRLNPYGEKLIKIWYDDSMPPKKYIWYKDEEYHFWNGQYWEPFELGDANEGVNNKDNAEKNHNHNHNKCDNHSCNCDCCEEIKFEKFKKEVLSAVLRMIRGHEQESPQELEDRIEVLERNVDVLMQINHDLFVKNSELESILEDLGYLKEDDIEDLEILSGLDERLNRIENRISDNEANIRNMNSRIANLENANYATKQYVDDAIANIHIDPFDPSGLEERIGSVESDLSQLNESVSEIEQIMDDNELVISSAFNDLNSRLLDVNGNISGIKEELNDSLSKLKEELEENLSEHEEVAAEAFNDLNDRMLVVENTPNEYNHEKELVIAAALNDLNDRMISVVERVDKIESDVPSGSDELTPDILVYHESDGIGYFESVGYNNMKNTLESNTGCYLVVSNDNDWMVFEIQNGENGVLLNRVEPPSTELLGTIEEGANDKYKLQFYGSLGVSDGTRFNWETSGTY